MTDMDSPEVAKILNNIGMVYLYQGNASDAINYHKQAIEVLQNKVGATHPCLVTFYYNLGLVYGFDDNFEQEIEQYEKALSVLRKSLRGNPKEERRIKAQIEKAKSNLSNGTGVKLANKK